MKNGKHNVLEELIDSFEQKVDKNQQNNQKEKVELNLDYNGKNSYDELVKIIFDYFEESQGIQLDSISTSYLRDKLTGKQNIPPIFAVDTDMGQTRFDIPVENIQKIFALHLAEKGYELVDLDFSDMVRFTYNQNVKNVGQETPSSGITEYGEIIESSHENSQLIQNNMQSRTVTKLRK